VYFVKKHIIPLFFLWMFLTPMVVKTFHRHSHVFTISKVVDNETQLNAYHGNCPICNFHFFQCENAHKYYNEVLKEVFGNYSSFYLSVFVQKYIFLSLSLRSPPMLLI